MRKKITAAGLALLIFIEITSPINAVAITLKEEEKLGKEFMKVITRQYHFIRDPLIVDYVNKIGKKILAVMPPQPFEYQFLVIRQPVYNAFAGPGAHICINSGLIEAMDNEDELAGILAHEIVHVKARHISQRIERSSKISVLSMAGMLAGIFLGAAGVGAAANAVTMGSAAAGQAAQLSYSRQDEMQADELGIRYLTASGYSGAGLLSMLKKIRSKQWFSSNDVPSYLLTHPAVESRITYLDTWIQSHPEAVPAAGKNQSEFDRFHLRMVAGYGDKKKALDLMSLAIKKSPDDPRINHSYSIALARNDRAKEAVPYMKKALSKAPFDAGMLKDMGEIYFIAGEYKNAVPALEGSISIDPKDHETLYLLGRSQLKTEQYSEAAASLEKLIDIRPNDPGALYYLGKACAKSGQMGEAHFYLGRHYMGKKDFRNAMFHFKQTEKYELPADKKEKVEEFLKKSKKKANKAPEIERPKSVRRNFGPSSIHPLSDDMLSGSQSSGEFYFRSK